MSNLQRKVRTHSSRKVTHQLSACEVGTGVTTQQVATQAGPLFMFFLTAESRRERTVWEDCGGTADHTNIGTTPQTVDSDRVVIVVTMKNGVVTRD
jgi:hypothetical protein